MQPLKKLDTIISDFAVDKDFNHWLMLGETRRHETLLCDSLFWFYELVAELYRKGIIDKCPIMEIGRDFMRRMHYYVTENAQLKLAPHELKKVMGGVAYKHLKNNTDMLSAFDVTIKEL